jgi:ATP-binding cassette, subfamily F, member 3
VFFAVFGYRKPPYDIWDLPPKGDSPSDGDSNYKFFRNIGGFHIGMINVENLSKSYGGHVLFDNISFKLNPKERLGLVGKNGHGKTTLCRIITGEESSDSGAVIIPRHYRIGYVRQELAFSEKTVLREAMKGLPENEKTDYWKAEKILAGLGFSDKDMQDAPEEFSGGFQVRLNLAKMLVSDPDLLLLDEPTNYLDITSIRWVEIFLKNWPHEVLLITHDRSFMDNVATHTMGIHRKKLRKVPGTTEKYYSQIAQEEEVYEKTRLNDERRQKDINEFITRFRAKARLANMVQSRIKLLDKMERSDRLEKLKTLDFAFQSMPFRGKYVVDINNLSFSYPAQMPIITDFNISIQTGDRLCIVGKNGKGKTTLIKLLAEHLTPSRGDIVYKSGVVQSFFEQTNVWNLNDSRTVEEEIQGTNPNLDRQAVRNICGAMMFPGDDALKKISILSGGEKSRVVMGKLLVTPANLLLLDEPTHHLDMDSCDALLAAIDNFQGTVIVVTHNEMFLHALAERLIVFQDGAVDVFEGSYQQFLEKRGWQDETGPTASRDRQSDMEKTPHRLTRKELRRRRSEIINERGKNLKPLEKKISAVENEIETQETALRELNDAMQDASMKQNGAEIAKISQAIHRSQSIVDKGFDVLEALTHTHEAEMAVFDKRMADLEDLESE